jgi:hypothetical protein
MSKHDTPIEDAVRKMLIYRGYADIYSPKGASSESKMRRFIIGKTQRGKKHPRPDAMCVVMIDLDPAFTGISTQNAIKLAYGQAISEKADQTSSIVYIYSFTETGPRIQSIDRAYQAVLAEMKDFGMTYYLEAIPIKFFRLDYSLPRTARKWKIKRRAAFDIMQGADGENIFIDKPPGIYTDDPRMKYIGARSGDYISYERLDCLQIGPIYSAAMARVKARKETLTQDILAVPSEGKAEEEYSVEAEEGEDESEMGGDEDSELLTDR